MIFPIVIADVDILIAVTAAILLASSVLISPQFGGVNLLVDKKRLANAAIFFGILFLALVAIRALALFLSFA